MTRCVVKAVVALLLPMVFGACEKKKEAVDRREADSLYSRTIGLIGSYSDSIATAPDSVSVSTLFARFNERLSELNFTVKADTDLLLTEGQNDTLTERLTALRSLRDSRLRSISQPDTTASDSLKQLKQLK